MITSIRRIINIQLTNYKEPVSCKLRENFVHLSNPSEESLICNKLITETAVFQLLQTNYFR